MTFYERIRGANDLDTLETVYTEILAAYSLTPLSALCWLEASQEAGDAEVANLLVTAVWRYERIVSDG